MNATDNSASQDYTDPGDQTKRSTTWFNSAQLLTREQNVLITVCVNWIWLLFTKVDDDKHHPHEHNQVTRKTNFTSGSRLANHSRSLSANRTIRDFVLCFVFSFTLLRDWSRKYKLPRDHLDTKLKQSWFGNSRFPAPFPHLTPRFHWIFEVRTNVLIGLLSFFGFGCTKLYPRALYATECTYSNGYIRRPVDRPGV